MAHSSGSKDTTGLALDSATLACRMFSFVPVCSPLEYYPPFTHSAASGQHNNHLPRSGRLDDALLCEQQNQMASASATSSSFAEAASIVWGASQGASALSFLACEHRLKVQCTAGLHNPAIPLPLFCGHATHQGRPTHWQRSQESSCPGGMSLLLSKTT